MLLLKKIIQTDSMYLDIRQKQLLYDYFFAWPDKHETKFLHNQNIKNNFI